MKDWAPIISACITSFFTVIGFFITIIVTTRNINQTLDGSSEWRKNLFKACSKKEIDMDDIHLLRTSLRYAKYPQKTVEYSFNWFSNKSIEFCNRLIAKDNSTEDFKLEFPEQEITRMIIRCLLKNHWEYSKVFYPLKTRYNNKKNRVIRVTTENIKLWESEFFELDGKDGEDNNSNMDTKQKNKDKQNSTYEDLRSKLDGVVLKEELEDEIENNCNNRGKKFKHILLILAILILYTFVSIFYFRILNKNISYVSWFDIIIVCVILTSSSIFLNKFVINSLNINNLEYKYIYDLLSYFEKIIYFIFLLGPIFRSSFVYSLNCKDFVYIFIYFILSIIPLRILSICIKSDKGKNDN